MWGINLLLLSAFIQKGWKKNCIGRYKKEKNSRFVLIRICEKSPIRIFCEGRNIEADRRCIAGNPGGIP